MNDDFPCTSCGECCKKVGAILASKEEFDPFTKFLIDKFPYETQWQNGWCEKLIEEDGEYKCSVYDERPLLCNVKAAVSYTHLRAHET